MTPMQLSRSASRRVAIGAASCAVVASLGGLRAPRRRCPTPTPTPAYTSTYETPAPTALAPLTGELVEVRRALTHSVARGEDRQPPRRPPAGRARAHRHRLRGARRGRPHPLRRRSGTRTSPPRSARSAPSVRWTRTSSRRSAASSPTRAASSASSRSCSSTNVYNAIHGQTRHRATSCSARKTKVAPAQRARQGAASSSRMHADLAAAAAAVRLRARRWRASSAVRDGQPIAGDRPALRRGLARRRGRGTRRPGGGCARRTASPTSTRTGAQLVGGRTSIVLRVPDRPSARASRRRSSIGSGRGLGLVAAATRSTRRGRRRPRTDADPPRRRHRHRRPAGAGQQLDRARADSRAARDSRSAPAALTRLRGRSRRLALTLGECQNSPWHSRVCRVPNPRGLTSGRDDTHTWQRSLLSTKRPVAASSAASTSWPTPSR